MLNQKTVQCQCFTGNAGRFALKALAPQGLLADISLAFVCNSEEEIGSGSSRKLIRREACRSAFAFVLECGGLIGEIVTGRKGNIPVNLDVKGQAGRVACAGPDKGTVILELARKTIAFESLNDPENGITVNVGPVRGASVLTRLRKIRRTGSIFGQ
jgi:glutamate carboxypeptidase